MYPAVHLGLSVLSADGSSARHGVIRDADTRNLLGLAMETQVLRAGAADSPGVAEATVTLADYGPGSALFAVPLVPPGQSAAVRVGAVEDRLVAHGRGMAIVPTAYLCAAIDHRVMDGMDAGALLGEMKRFLEQ
jgi:pyruvate/2-oxoglutarate dehydrogenase complex dihydrolipoamide acyltransferase (E2) component